MPGFIDVGGMTAEEVRRMGHADDYDDEPQSFGYRRGALRQPAPPRNNPVLQVGYTVSDVWAAACAAQRVNGAYYKDVAYEWDEAARVQRVVKRKNRDIMMEFLQNPDRILVEDVEAGEECRKFLEQDITFRALKGRLTEFDNSTKKVLAVKERFYTVANNYELAVVACLPNSAQRARNRQNLLARLAVCSAVDAVIGSKVQLNVEVLESKYNNNFNIYWIKAVTSDNCAVSFSRKESYDVGTWLTIEGKVKNQTHNSTQLNYVKVL